jgi:hypothetical protein
MVRVIDEKTKSESWIPLIDEETGARLYPELMAELDAIKRDRIGGLMLRRDWGERGPWPTWLKPDQPDFTHMGRKVKEVIPHAEGEALHGGAPGRPAQAGQNPLRARRHPDERRCAQPFKAGVRLAGPAACGTARQGEVEVRAGGHLMSRASSSFRETDLKRALRAIEAAGKKVRQSRSRTAASRSGSGTAMVQMTEKTTTPKPPTT